MKLNVELLLEVKQAILDEPLRLNMEHWVRRSHDPLHASCGTITCIAGHAVMIDLLKRAKKTFKNKRFIHNQIEGLNICPDAAATTLLGLTGTQSTRLFYVPDWPAKFHDAYCKIKGIEGIKDLTRSQRIALARVTADRIDHFIKTRR